jgi:predicted MFS family arabinose efflux permease
VREPVRLAAELPVRHRRTVLDQRGVAEKSIVPALVPDVQIPDALARQEARSRAAVLAGPPLGGILYGLSAGLPFLFDAISYVASFGTTFFIHAELKAKREQPAGGLLGEIRDGIRWLLHEPFIRMSVVLVGLINIVFQGLMLTLIVLTGKLGASSAMTGVVLGCYGLGGLIGALAAPRLQRHASPKSVAIGATWIWAGLLAPLSIVSSVPILCPLVALISFLGPLWNVVLVGYQYRIIPSRLLSRVKSVVLLVSWGTIPFGSLIAGYLLDRNSPQTTVLVLAGLMTVIARSRPLARVSAPSQTRAPLGRRRRRGGPHPTESELKATGAYARRGLRRGEQVSDSGLSRDLKLCDEPGTFAQSRFLHACRSYNRGELTDTLIEQTARLGSTGTGPTSPASNDRPTRRAKSPFRWTCRFSGGKCSVA